jgi:hypothetical protein
MRTPMSRREKQGFYYQQIAQSFLARRGAPYVLSSRDMVMISSWEETGIPLGVVLEGIERTFERSRPRLARGRKMSSLSFCQTEVMRAHAEFRDRKVGRESKERSREDKRKKVKLEVRRFLESLPAELEFLREAYREAQAALSRKNVAEDSLERLDEKVEKLIIRQAEAGGWSDMEKGVPAVFPGRPEADVQEISRLRLVKRWREKYRIPYLSLFYY